MKIALPTMDGKTISDHFGRCKTFLVFETEGNAIIGREERTNAQGGGEPHDCGQHGHGHDHGAFARLLSDCQAVIIKGIGPGAVRAIAGAGLKIYMANPSASPEEAVFRLLGGSLEVVNEGSCAGH
ncbi:NifB/NifX family molybdenum-iron cluster-binding protein [Holophaga foetida]|uniref:NifB/NifX family molybdenum-iron cluster-binding protein n=1 Tax=Holophaga foetida TaxID=35839 RepID=UPI0002471823|nr:NifB/NifX family molybdenum-iron cluster-binding protein [Holophaga foetida]